MHGSKPPRGKLPSHPAHLKRCNKKPSELSLAAKLQASEKNNLVNQSIEKAAGPRQSSWSISQFAINKCEFLETASTN